MNKKIKFTIVIIWILFSRGYDIYCTTLHTPKLSKEANPLVSIIGISSWNALLIIIGIITAYTIYAYYISTFRPINLLPTEKKYSFVTFSAFVYLGFKDNWIATLYKSPKPLKRLNHYMGHILPKCFVFAGIITTLMWLLINHTSYYSTLHNPLLIYLVLIGECVLIVYLWHKSMYRYYLSAS